MKSKKQVKKSLLKALKKNKKLERKVTAKDLDEWAKRFKGKKYLLKFGSNKIGYIDPIEFEGVVE